MRVLNQNGEWVDPEDPSVREMKRQKCGPRLLANGTLKRRIGILGLLAILGTVLIYHGIRKLNETARSSQMPQEMTLADLIARGPQGNPYVRITGYRACNTFVEVRKKNHFQGDAYVAIVPADPNQSAGGEAIGPVVIVKTDSLEAQWDFPDSAIEGMVTDESLNSQAKEKLVQQYPALRLGNVMVIEKDSGPTPPQLSWSFIGLGVASWLTMMFIVVFSYLKERRALQAEERVIANAIQPVDGEQRKLAEGPLAELAEILWATRELLARPGNDFGWYSWSTAGEALSELDQLIETLATGSLPKRSKLEVLFLPTGPVQEVSLTSGWGEEFLALARQFDAAAARAYG